MADTNDQRTASFQEKALHVVKRGGYRASLLRLPVVDHCRMLDGNDTNQHLPLQLPDPNLRATTLSIQRPQNSTINNLYSTVYFHGVIESQG